MDGNEESLEYIVWKTCPTWQNYLQISKQNYNETAKMITGMYPKFCLIFATSYAI
jgi:hypothetical protein